MIETKVIIEDAELFIKHEECHDPSWCRDKSLFIESKSNENNTITTLIFNNYLSVYIYWESHSSAASFEALFVPETGVIFIGCGSMSARVSTKLQKLIDNRLRYSFLGS